MIARTLRLSVLAAVLALSCAVAPRADAPLPSVAASGHAPYVAVLVWHDVVRDGKDVWFDTTTDTLRGQFAAIAGGGFHVVTMAALRNHLEHGAALPAKPLVLTFDDNGSGIYENAYPLLRRYRFAATLFVHTNYVGRTTSKHHNTWDQLREMQRSGLVDIASLTANHPEDLRTLSDADIAHEFKLSKFSIEHRLGTRVYAFAYPYDNYDDRVARIAQQQGFALGFTEDWGNAGDSASTLLVHRYSILTRFDQALADVARGHS